MTGGVEDRGDVPPESVLGGMTFPAWPEVAGAIAVVVPLFFSAESYTTRTIDGDTEVISYSNMPATVCGVIAALCGVFALVMVARTLRARRVARIVAAFVLLAAGGLQIARGQGVFFEPGGAQTAGPAIDMPDTRTVPTPDPDAAGAQAFTACVNGDDAACATAAPFAQRMCDTGDLSSCVDYGMLLMNGRGVAVDHAGAGAAFSKACDGGDAQGCTNLSVPYYEGRGVARDVDRAAELAGKGCDAGNGNGCRNLGVILRDAREDLAGARAAFARSCEVENADAQGCGLLGAALYQGTGGPKNVEAARAAFGRGCELGDAEACWNVGVLSRDAEGGPSDPPLQRRAWSRGCELGRADACNDGGVMYLEGKGGDPDLAAAARMFARACERDSGLGCSNLGEMHRDATGVEPSVEKALALFTRGCELESSRACYMLGELRSSDGSGAGEAHEAYRRACELGHRDACKKSR